MKDGLVADLKEWPFSNYLEFIEARKGGLLVAGYRERFFPTAKEYEAFVEKYCLDENDDLEKALFGAK